MPSREQLKEIWFTHNLVGNFINNLNFQPGGRPDKIVRWFESIYHAYPYDASMVAGMARAYRMVGDTEKLELNRRKFHNILEGSTCWLGNRAGSFRSCCSSSIITNRSSYIHPTAFDVA